MRADIRTSPIVCWWYERWSPVTSSTPSMLPRGSMMGAAEQVRKLFAWMKCSPACTSVGSSSISAVPIALVPFDCSAQFTPGANATLPARARNSSSPTECRIVPCASVSTIMLSVLMICSNSISITGAACVNRRWLRSRAIARSPRTIGSKSGRSTRVRPSAAQRRCDCSMSSARAGRASPDCAVGVVHAPGTGRARRDADMVASSVPAGRAGCLIRYAVGQRLLSGCRRFAECSILVQAACNTVGQSLRGRRTVSRFDTDSG